jgi:hypothetical protein
MDTFISIEPEMRITLSPYLRYAFYHNSALPSIVGLLNEFSLYVEINDPINNINTLTNYYYLLQLLLLLCGL